MEGLKKDYKKRHQNDAFFVYVKSNKKMVVPGGIEPPTRGF